MTGKKSAFSSGLVLLLLGAWWRSAYLMPSGTDPAFRPLASPAKPIELVVPALKIHAHIKPIEVNAQNVLDPPERRPRGRLVAAQRASRQRPRPDRARPATPCTPAAA